MWFEELTGFPEQSPEQVRANFELTDDSLRSLVNGKVYICGKLETPSLAKLRERVHSTSYQRGKSSVCEIVADVQQLHADPSNAGSLFQVASQFNLLEMGSPRYTPE